MDPICAADDLLFPIFDNLILPEDLENDFSICCYDRPTWFFLTVDQSGDLKLKLDSGADIDYEVYGPFSSQEEAVSTCGEFGDSNRVDAGDKSGRRETINITGAQAGEIYVLLVSNYGFRRDSGFVTLKQIGGGGSTDCNPEDDSHSVTGTFTANTSGSTFTGTFTDSTGTFIGTFTGTFAEDGTFSGSLDEL